MSSQNRSALFFAGLVTGGMLGAGMALLLALHSGVEIRFQIRNKSLELKDGAVAEQPTQAKRAPTPELMAWTDDGGPDTAGRLV